MAGIGFRLDRMLRSEDLYSKAGGAVSSVFLSSGPFLCTILSIAVISLLPLRREEITEQQIFRVIINYTFAASLILFSLLEMVTTRYIADMIYLRQEKAIPTLFSLTAAATLASSCALGLAFYWLTGIHWHEAVTAAALLSSVSLIWCAMIFLSACKDYAAISRSFGLGMLVSVGTSWLAVRYSRRPMQAQLVGFTLGQWLTAGLLGFQIFKEFGIAYAPIGDYGAYFRRNRVFVFVGLFYGVAIWIDKLVFWFSPRTREWVAPYFFKSSAYDTGMFLSYFFVIPAMAYFLVQIETSFYVAYRNYFSIIDNRAPLRVIEQGRLDVLSCLKEQMRGLLVFQSLITIPAMLLAPQIMGFLGVQGIYSTVFRYGLIGASLHVFLLFSNIVILYFDLPRVAVRNYGLFLGLNAGFSWASTYLDYRYHGLGYALAALVGLVVSLASLSRVIRDAQFIVFMRQPLGMPTMAAGPAGKVDLR